MTAIIGSFRAAWNLSKQINGLKIDVMKQNAELARDLTDDFKKEFDKIEERLRVVERDMARRNNRH